MKILLTVLLMLILWCPALHAEPYAVVRVNTEDRGGTSHGSGTCIGWDIDYGLIVTAWHVVRDNRGQATVDFVVKRKIVTLNVEVVATDRLWDLAALVVKRPDWEDLPFMGVGVNKPKIGDKITIAGFGQLGLRTYRESEGAVVGFCAPSPTAAYDLMVVDTPARQGDSGGPLRAQNGLLVGVLFGSDKATHGSHCERVRMFLKDQLEDSYPELLRRVLHLYVLYEPRMKNFQKL